MSLPIAEDFSMTFRLTLILDPTAYPLLAYFSKPNIQNT